MTQTINSYLKNQNIKNLHENNFNVQLKFILATNFKKTVNF